MSINKVIKYSLGLNQSKTKYCFDINPEEEILLARESERDVCVNIIKSNDTYYVIFRGSRLGNWYDNLRIDQKIIPYHVMDSNTKIRVHGGFLGAYKSVRFEVLNWFLEHAPCPIIVGGHSLGGALATLCALDLQYHFPENRVSCISLGSPRVGNWAFARSYNKRVPKTTRIVHGNDIVSRLPLAWLFYKHVGKRLHQGNKWKFWLLPWGSIKDHLAYEEFK